MPHNKQSAKRVLTNEKARILNKEKRSSMKTNLKRVQKAIEVGDKVAAQKEFEVAQQKIDKAAKHRIIHPNAAARYKSNLVRAISAMK